MPARAEAAAGSRAGALGRTRRLAAAGLALQRVLLGSLLFLLFACSGKPGAVVPLAEEAPVRAYPVFVVSHGWHTGIIVPGSVLNEALAELSQHFGTPDHYEIGWGDAGFYQAQDITVALALRALFWSRGAVLHLVAFSGKPQHYFKGEPVYATCLSARELSALQRYLVSSFLRNDTEPVVPLRPGLYGESAFYSAAGRYHLFNTCNRWTAGALQAGGLDVSPRLSLTASRVLYSARWQGQPCPVLP